MDLTVETEIYQTEIYPRIYFFMTMDKIEIANQILSSEKTQKLFFF